MHAPGGVAEFCEERIRRGSSTTGRTLRCATSSKKRDGIERRMQLLLLESPLTTDRVAHLLPQSVQRWGQWSGLVCHARSDSIRPPRRARPN